MIFLYRKIDIFIFSEKNINFDHVFLKKLHIICIPLSNIIILFIKIIFFYLYIGEIQKNIRKGKKIREKNQITCDIIETKDLEPLQVIAIMEKIEYINKFHTYKLCENKKKGEWYTRVKAANKEKLYAKTQEELIDKLYMFYGGISDFSFGSIFNEAIKKHLDDADNTRLTYDRSVRDYNRYISEDFSKKDIRLIKSSDIDKYIMSYLKKYEVETGKCATDKMLYAIKSIFNIVFRYATEGDYPILANNPVPQDNSKYKKHTYSPKPKASEKAFQPEEIEKIKNFCWDRVKNNNNYVVCVNAYAVLVAIDTGMRCAELCALKWKDITESSIHIHAQILCENEKQNTYKYVNWTKNEKGHSCGGREYPIMLDLSRIFADLRHLQEVNGINSEWVFARANGSYMRPDTYRSALRKIAKENNTKLTNNHAFRIALNSYVFIPSGVPETERAEMLGHSVEVNLENYSYALADAKNETKNKIEQYMGCQKSDIPPKKSIPTQTPPNIIVFEQRKRTLKAAKLKGSC